MSNTQCRDAPRASEFANSWFSLSVRIPVPNVGTHRVRPQDYRIILVISFIIASIASG